MNPKEFFEEGMIRPALPGENWDMTKEEAHCFDSELGRLQLHTDIETPAVSHWIGLVKQAFESGGGTTNSTPELFAYIQGAYPPALVHMTAVRPEDPKVWRELLESEYLREENNMTLEEAEARFADAEAEVFRLPCNHLAMEHAALIDAWYVRNIESTKYRRSTLYHMWGLPPQEILFGKQFVSWHDLVSEIEVEVDARNRSARNDQAFVESLVDMLMQDDETLKRQEAKVLAQARLDGLDISRARDTRRQLVGKANQMFRILGQVPMEYRELVKETAE